MMVWGFAKAGLVAASIAVTSAAGFADVPRPQFSIEGTAWEQATLVDPLLLYSIALVESRRTEAGGRYLRPWPWAINYQGRGYYFDTRAEAEDFISAVMESGDRSFDVGPMQINYRWHQHRVSSPNDLLDLNTSIAVGEQILIEAINSAPGEPALGVGRYHSWSDMARSRDYGRRVLAIHDLLHDLSKPSGD